MKVPRPESLRNHARLRVAGPFFLCVKWCFINGLPGFQLENWRAKPTNELGMLLCGGCLTSRAAVVAPPPARTSIRILIVRNEAERPIELGAHRGSSGIAELAGVLVDIERLISIVQATVSVVVPVIKSCTGVVEEQCGGPTAVARV